MLKPRLVVLGLSLALAMVGCARTPPSSGSSSAHAQVKACLVSGANGFDDKGASRAASQGLDRAVAQLGVQSDRAEAHSVGDYPAAIQSMVGAGCTYILGASPDQSDALAAAARANTDLHFALVGATKPVSEKNLKLVRFQSSQVGFLAGYLAAASSSSGTVGTFGATNAPAVTLYMDGFSQGITYFNQKASKAVKLVGWTMGSQSGDFLGGADPYSDKEGARARTEDLIGQGADVIMPVAGTADTGAVQAVNAHQGTRLVGTGSDLCASYVDACAATLGTAAAGVDQMVFDAIEEAGAGFTNTTLVGTLANGGVTMVGVGKGAPVAQNIADDLTAVSQGIKDGSIKVTSPSSVS
ncbi:MULTISPECIES: BMP family ABC transporter substrate-binding protein [Propionibacterium]|uniref:BMP family ABC transporter substrate-binding protein n=1 Tax=Propionibacterium TaxID=1743 RepID=UPI000541CA67|nr:BMP family ABC transporter substrate-binding protein [Propionibacterium freudenreichii]MDK9342450.1 BMP family ABC transporter substrate-binding protein [Propionibacterium freudenreichii]MDK9670930.1 BMP family ABC transporter substrate-binding protein [Propionibacterium freudenreichii]CEG89315.1 Hypothetical secreted protein [Propionibacterium freudenreichii]